MADDTAFIIAVSAAMESSVDVSTNQTLGRELIF
jgi:hypothetical protein